MNFVWSLQKEQTNKKNLYPSDLTSVKFQKMQTHQKGDQGLPAEGRWWMNYKGMNYKLRGLDIFILRVVFEGLMAYT